MREGERGRTKLTKIHSLNVYVNAHFFRFPRGQTRHCNLLTCCRRKTAGCSTGRSPIAPMTPGIPLIPPHPHWGMVGQLALVWADAHPHCRSRPVTSALCTNWSKAAISVWKRLQNSSMFLCNFVILCLPLIIWRPAGLIREAPSTKWTACTSPKGRWYQSHKNGCQTCHEHFHL